MRRVERSGKPVETNFRQEEEDRTLPPRKIVHPSERGVWTKRFYNTLLVLFVSLILFLIFWFRLREQA